SSAVSSPDLWIARFTDSVDLAILRRLIALTGSDVASVCWCVCGASGRGESIVRRQPYGGLGPDDREDPVHLENQYAKVIADLAECDYFLPAAARVEPSFRVATVGEWNRRYEAWIQNPVVEGLGGHRR